MYQKLWSLDVQFLRNGALQTDGHTDGWKKWHNEVGAPPTNRLFSSFSSFFSQSDNHVFFIMIISQFCSCYPFPLKAKDKSLWKFNNSLVSKLKMSWKTENPHNFNSKHTLWGKGSCKKTNKTKQKKTTTTTRKSLKMKIRIRKNIRRMIKITIVASYVKENLTIFMTKKYKVLYQES